MRGEKKAKPMPGGVARPREAVIASEAKQPRCLTSGLWVATSAYGLLAMTEKTGGN